VLRTLTVATAMALALSGCSKEDQSSVQANSMGPAMMGNGMMQGNMMGNGMMQGNMMGNGTCDNCADHMNTMMSNGMGSQNMMEGAGPMRNRPTDHDAHHPK